MSSYGANNWIYAAKTDIQGRSANDHWRTFAVNSSTTESPLFRDALWRGGGPDHRIATKDAAPSYNGEWSGYDAETQHFAIERHGRGVNFMFFDLHVEGIRPARKLWSLRWHKTYHRDGYERTKHFPAWMR